VTGQEIKDSVDAEMVRIRASFNAVETSPVWRARITGGVLVVLVIALSFATYRCDSNKGKLTAREAGDARHKQISSAQAPRAAVRERETLYAGIDQANDSLATKRAAIAKAELKQKNPTQKEVAANVQSKTKGNIDALARLFKFAGYSCSVR
jgi:hypothetical protein